MGGEFVMTTYRYSLSKLVVALAVGKLEAIVRDLEAFVETGALGSSAIRRTARVPQPVVAEQQSPSVASFGRKGL